MVINKINEQLKILNEKGEIIVVNDFSKERYKEFEKLENIELIKILNLLIKTWLPKRTKEFYFWTSIHHNF